MGDITEKYISGPKLKVPIPECSIAEYFFPLLKSQPKDNIIQVDSITGYAETSRQFLEKSLKACKGYQKLGLGQDDVFTVIARNSSDVYSAVMGVFWLGGVVAPLDFLLKHWELKGILAKIKPTVVICDDDVLDNVVPALNDLGIKDDVKIIIMTGNRKQYIAFKEILDVQVDIDNYNPQPVNFPSTKIAIILPTSGSTGLPKGVGLTHRNILYQTKNMEQLDIGYTAKSCLITSHFYWITCTLTLVTSLSTGMKRIYMSEVNSSNILQAIDKYKPEYCLLAPGTFCSLGRLENIDKYDFSCFKFVILAGSQLSQGLLDSIKRVWNNLPILNAYGLTETSSIAFTCGRGDTVLSVGSPGCDVKVKIVDPDTGIILGPNQIGEIYISSPGIMKEYVGNQYETDAIITGGWCKSGDLGYYDESKNFYVIDRLKELIKNPGNFQIAPSEIEGIIMTIPEVVEAGVVGIFPEPDKFYLIALVVKKDGSNITEENIKSKVQENMADYKHLKCVKFVDKLPRSNVGKLMRKSMMQMAESLVLK